ncbi:MAG: alpha/beta hydrolase [Pseudomonadota bacterium]
MNRRSFLAAMASGTALDPSIAASPPTWKTGRAKVAGLEMHYVEQGTGPAVLLCHGFPECWISWRYQIGALAAAGFRVIAPDLRGYGRTGGPKDVAAYGIASLVGDVAGLLDALGERKTALVGHDFGAVLAWHAALLEPQRFHAVAALSVPFRQPALGPGPVAQLRSLAGGNFNYILYFQEADTPEAELEADIPRFLRSMFYTVSAQGLSRPRPGMSRPTKLLHTLTDPGSVPEWIGEDAFQEYVLGFKANGLGPALNWYRNLDANWAAMSRFAGAKIEQPAVFICGAQDPVLRNTRSLFERMPATVARLSESVIIPDCGHWVQQERPEHTNAALLKFLKSVH